MSPALVPRFSIADLPNVFRRGMRDDGFIIIEPDGKTFPSFSLRHWHMESFLARKFDNVYVPLIHARRPQHGALSKLIHDIEIGAGLQLAVIAPIGSMQTILMNWLYEPHPEMICGGIEQVWRATRR